MIELDENFSLANLGNVRKEAFEILYNKTRVSSWEGHLYITPDKVYFIVAPAGMEGRSIADIGGAPKSWCIDVNEIASYGKYGLGGFKITLKDGSVKEYAQAMSVIDIAKDLSEGLARVACAGEIDGKVVDTPQL